MVCVDLFGHARANIAAVLLHSAPDVLATAAEKRVGVLWGAGEHNSVSGALRVQGIRAPRWDGCWRSLTEGRPCWWSPHHRTKVEPADALPSCAGGSSTTRNVHTLTDLSSSNGAEVELVSLIEEQLPRYRLRADTLTEFGGKSLSLHERQSW
ncbi:hypothetical protein MRX96_004143 [Rhipicephalus microplus]